MKPINVQFTRYARVILIFHALTQYIRVLFVNISIQSSFIEIMHISTEKFAQNKIIVHMCLFEKKKNNNNK